MSRCFGVDALGADLGEIARRNLPHQGTRHVAVVCVRSTPELSPGVPMLTARDSLAKAKLEPVQISFRVVRHVTVLRIDRGWGYPPTAFEYFGGAD